MTARSYKVIQSGADGKKLIRLDNNLSNTSSGDMDDFSRSFLSNPEVENRFKEWMEATMYESYIKYQFSPPKRSDDPFDAIYLSELKPDDVISDDVMRIMKYSNIKDLSDQIHFDDGWDD